MDPLDLMDQPQEAREALKRWEYFKHQRVDLGSKIQSILVEFTGTRDKRLWYIFLVYHLKSL